MPADHRPNLEEQPMRPSRRKPQNKAKAARKFKRNVSRTKALNVTPMRGGYRL